MTDVWKWDVVGELQVATRVDLEAGGGDSRALDRVTRAVSVVSARAGGVPHATTVDSFTIVSRDPTVCLVALSSGSTMLDVIARAGTFAVSVLAADQERLSRHFASRRRGWGNAQLAGVAHEDGRWSCAPLLSGAVAWFECQVTALVPAGGHVLVLADLLHSAAGPTERPALVRRDRAYRSLPFAGTH